MSIVNSEANTLLTISMKNSISFAIAVIISGAFNGWLYYEIDKASKSKSVSGGRSWFAANCAVSDRCGVDFHHLPCWHFYIC
jgi:hypothetical protein